MIKLFFFYTVLFCSVLFSFDPVIIVLGPPGAGKGTFSQFLKENYGYNHLSAGDIVRREIDKQTPVGKRITDIVKKGEYIDTKIMQSLISQNIRECKSQEKPFIIDGFGRTYQEIEFLYDFLLKLDLLSQTLVLFFEAEDSLCRERMFGRLVCSHCEHIYNTSTAPPITPGKCDLCFKNITKRINDTKEIIDSKIYDYRNRVESNYKRALSLFPYLLYNTDQDIEACVQNYRDLVQRISNFNGSAKDFIRREGE